MPALIARPGADRRQLALDALRLVRAWCRAHDVEPPHLRFGPLTRGCGQYYRGGIRIDLDRCGRQAAERGRAWSWPGNRVDRTPAGVVAHEAGHHAWERLLTSRQRADWYGVSRRGRVTSYEPIPEEAFAETFRVFLLNPGLLAGGSLARYDALCGYGLDPAHDAPWRDVLAFAPARIQAAAERWAS